jgi:hypothetical protein
MSTIRQHSFNGLCALSLLLMLAMLALWMRGLWVSDEYRKVFGQGIHIGTQHQEGIVNLSLERVSNGVWPFTHDAGGHQETPVGKGGRLFRSPWFVHYKSWDEPFLNLSGTEIQIADWFIVVALAILPAIWFFNWRKKKKPGPGVCGKCSYDLTGNETGTCPECGTVLADSAQTQNS